MDEKSRERLHERVARRLHGISGRQVTVAGLNDLRETALRGRPLNRRRAAAETYRALTGERP